LILRSPRKKRAKRNQSHKCEIYRHPW
jgi:hypothetical protein